MEGDNTAGEQPNDGNNGSGIDFCCMPCVNCKKPILIHLSNQIDLSSSNINNVCRRSRITCTSCYVTCQMIEVMIPPGFIKVSTGYTENKIGLEITAINQDSVLQGMVRKGDLIISMGGCMVNSKVDLMANNGEYRILGIISSLGGATITGEGGEVPLSELSELSE